MGMPEQPCEITRVLLMLTVMRVLIVTVAVGMQCYAKVLAFQSR